MPVPAVHALQACVLQAERQLRRAGWAVRPCPPVLVVGRSTGGYLVGQRQIGGSLGRRGRAFNRWVPRRTAANWRLSRQTCSATAQTLRARVHPRGRAPTGTLAKNKFWDLVAAFTAQGRAEGAALVRLSLRRPNCADLQARLKRAPCSAAMLRAQCPHGVQPATQPCKKCQH